MRLTLALAVTFLFAAPAFAQQTCLSHNECGVGNACVYPGVCQPGQIASPMNFAVIDATTYYTYADGSCNYDTDCGPWVCQRGWCVTPEVDARVIRPRSTYAYYDTSCNNDMECGGLTCVAGWCRDANEAAVFRGTPAGQPQQPTYQQPTYQQPTYQQPTYQQPTYQQPSTIPGMLSHNGTGYSLSCPSTWTVDRTDATTDIMCIDPVADGFSENCNVVMENTGVPYDPVSYWNASQQFLAGVTGFMVNSQRPVTVGNQASYRVDYSHAIYGSPMRVLAYFFNVGATGYVLTCTASPTSYATYEGTFDQIASSVVFY